MDIEVNTLAQIKAETGRDLDNQVDENTLVSGEKSNGTFGAFKLFAAIKNCIDNWITTIAGAKNFTGAVTINSKAVATTEAVNNALANYTQKVFNRTGTNDTPDYYISNYATSTVYELKQSSIIGLTDSYYAELITYVPWVDTSVIVVQEALCGKSKYHRISNGNGWTDWVQVETKKLILSGNTGQSVYYNYDFDSLDNGLYEVDYHFGSLLTELSGIVVFAKLNEYSGVSSEPQIIIATNGRTVNKTQIISNTWNDGVTLFKIR